MKNTVMLKKNYEFKRVLTKGKRFNGKLIDIFIIKNNTNINKLGIAISKKSGNSVKRNAIRRIIRENYRLLEEKLKLGNDIVILWKRQADFKNFNFFYVKEECENLFIKSDIL